MVHLMVVRLVSLWAEMKVGGLGESLVGQLEVLTAEKRAAARDLKLVVL